MSKENTTMNTGKVVSFKEILKEKGSKEPVFSQGLLNGYPPSW